MSILIDEFKITLLWVALIVCALLTLVPQLQMIGKHGKVTLDESIPNNLWTIVHTSLQVPKALFKIMYAIGFAFVLFIMWLETPFFLSMHFYILLLWTFHNFRRLLETINITNFGQSKMHLGGFVAGLIHYTLVPLTFVGNRENITHSSLKIFLSIGLFIISNILQFQHHYILYKLKTKQMKEKGNKYALPTEFLFAFVCTPHYTMEILIYLSFALLYENSLSILCMTLWVICNLSIVSNNQYNWYMQHYRQHIPHHWQRIIPFVW